MESDPIDSKYYNQDITPGRNSLVLRLPLLFWLFDFFCGKSLTFLAIKPRLSA